MVVWLANARGRGREGDMNSIVGPSIVKATIEKALHPGWRGAGEGAVRRPDPAPGNGMASGACFHAALPATPPAAQSCVLKKTTLKCK